MSTGERMKLQAILWDMDGTLVDSEPVHDKAFHATVTELGLTVPFDFHSRLLGLSSVDVHAALVKATGAELTLLEWQQLKWQHYQRLADEIQPLAGILPILQQYQQRRTPMAVVSNSTRGEVDLNLSVSGLAAYFPVTISRNEVVMGKPAPDCYWAAAKALGIAPEACVVIEDSVTGSKAGLAAGMTTIYHPEQLDQLHKCPQGAVALAPGGGLAALLAELLG